MNSNDHLLLRQYIANHPQVADVLFTGGDPMVMSAATLRKYIEPLLGKDTESLQTVRIGSKSLAYWPWRFVSDADSDEILKLFSDVVRSGKQLSFQAHFSHPRELQTAVVRQAISLIRSTGAQIRCQAPLVRRVNDNATVWKQMWNLQVQLGLIPYYM
jgi:L-lysine 2,3-aminomutase